MDRDRWGRIEDVFHRALAARDEERARLLGELCAGDADLRREVSLLLAGALDAGASIRGILAVEATTIAVDTSAPAVGRRLGPYRLRALLGEGGMGAVYLADRDDAQFAKQVAIKILPHAIGSPQAVARFRDERQILAALDHRNIVRLLDGGSTDDGLPYLVMEHIEGQPITAFARKHALSVRDRIQLVRDVCTAIQYAHQNLIIHRDVKPSNILVDKAGTPKLVDFGIAKLLAPLPSFEREARTRTGHTPFTPEYASPEQARGEAVSTATDVYSVGAVLYELVTDQPPFRAIGDLVETIRIICDVDPVRPSLAAPPERHREIAGDLDNIIFKALHKEPGRRYGTIEQLSDDLRRFLCGMPVNARVATLGYRARKFAGRHKAAVLATLFIMVALLAGTVISVRQARLAEDAATSALVAKTRAEIEKERAETETAHALAETARARNAEHRVQEQLEQIKVEAARRREAEDRVSDALNVSAESKDKLKLVLLRMGMEKQLVEQGARKAREAEARAEAETARARIAADRARSAESQVEAHLERLKAEEARRKEAETKREEAETKREEAERWVAEARREQLRAVAACEKKRSPEPGPEGTRRAEEALSATSPLTIRQIRQFYGIGEP
jgi:hypothetical protein